MFVTKLFIGQKKEKKQINTTKCQWGKFVCRSPAFSTKKDKNIELHADLPFELLLKTKKCEW